MREGVVGVDDACVRGEGGERDRAWERMRKGEGVGWYMHTHGAGMWGEGRRGPLGHAHGGNGGLDVIHSPGSPVNHGQVQEVAQGLQRGLGLLQEGRVLQDADLGLGGCSGGGGAREKTRSPCTQRSGCT